MERKTQLYFYDNNKFEFIKRPLKYSCLLEMKGEQLKRGWPHAYIGQYLFPGYKNISADTVTLGFARDIFLDPHNKIPETEEVSGKPKKGGKAVKDWIAKIAENQRHIYRTKRKGHALADSVNWTLIGVILLMVVGWMIRFATGG